ncbi:hypothetical protein ACJJIR_11585 [Microbulbifer sp. SSSA008]|uniref:hypothetical protein n=1 Tax=Microbulbifer sp. SSSA008 TaxID=3243380 RepID=UPI004039887A
MMGAWGKLGSELLTDLGDSITPIADKWGNFTAWFEDMDDESDIDPYPDIFVWTDCVLVMNEKSREVLNNLLEKIGEFLPFAAPKGRYFAYIPHLVVHAKEEESKREVRNGIEMESKSIVFSHEEVGTKAILKTAFNIFTCAFCTDILKKSIQ